MMSAGVKSQFNLDISVNVLVQRSEAIEESADIERSYGSHRHPNHLPAPLHLQHRSTSTISNVETILLRSLFAFLQFPQWEHR